MRSLQASSLVLALLASAAVLPFAEATDASSSVDAFWRFLQGTTNQGRGGGRPDPDKCSPCDPCDCEDEKTDMPTSTEEPTTTSTEKPPGYCGDKEIYMMGRCWPYDPKMELSEPQKEGIDAIIGGNIVAGLINLGDIFVFNIEIREPVFNLILKNSFEYAAKRGRGGRDDDLWGNRNGGNSSLPNAPQLPAGQEDPLDGGYTDPKEECCACPANETSGDYDGVSEDENDITDTTVNKGGSVPNAPEEPKEPKDDYDADDDTGVVDSGVVIINEKGNAIINRNSRKTKTLKKEDRV
ncbi:unnamed protein product [Vitrella brassicaformis CCMP3155]|uniref:Uncharacterized protein n=1 Tax=Vitrella brassicaformis (strain CCMP3155) TaxID=1169540 RepID=A0A0G4EMW4_VITBC|nr:unnamed protein product [Vitrella brassicaformis CCMP3155]|mmetsp:Transcript_30612/g.75986  ORF Transcript_30612/g.75986 Transcript_30612/m.75986 type:complete len:296 (-) Transcript_30612:895-1782(-)|eukprot:CEL98325.1 unnamed protein product [Vitrella brassicaformis CCMP3155]